MAFRLRRPPRRRSSRLIRAVRAITRAELGQLTGLSRTAVAARVAALAELGLVTEREQAPSTGGRPADAAHLQRRRRGRAVAWRSASAGPGWRCATSPARCWPSRDIDQEVALGPDDLMPDVVKRLDVAARGHRRARLRRRAEPARDGRPRARLQPRFADPAAVGTGLQLRPYFAELPPFGCARDPGQRRQRHRAGRATAATRRPRRRAGHQGLDRSRSGHHRRGVLQRGAAQAAGEFGHNKTAAAQGLPCRCGDTGCLEADRGRLGAGAGAAAAGPRGAASARRRRARPRR